MTTESQFHSVLAQSLKTAEGAHVESVAGLGLTLAQALKLMVFAATYGPQLWSIIAAVLAVVKAPGGITPQGVSDLVAKHGPETLSMIEMIAGFFGVQIPK